MRGLLFCLALLLPVSVKAAPCEEGAAATLEGEFLFPPVFDGEEWFWPGTLAATPCGVATLRGRGPLPPECVAGKRMRLRGQVLKDGILYVQVTDIACF